jgi:hypothetical protein
MSYSFDGANDSLRGQFGTTYNSVPITLACFIKITAHPTAADAFVMIGETINSDDHSHVIRTDAVDNGWQGISDAGASNGTVTVSSIDLDAATIGTTYNATTGWAGIVGVFTANTQRDLFVAAIANTAQTVQDRAVNNGLSYISCGETLAALNDFNGLLAEVAIWNAALNSSDITSYLGGTAASQISAANLIGYWALNANGVLTNEGVDTGGDLTASGAVFNADHPTITVGGSVARSSKKRLMMGVA